MATVKISELPAILGANTATTDVIPIVDVSGNITNKITREEFFKNIASVDINGGTIDGAVIGGSSAAAGTFTTVTASGDVTIADKIVHSGDTNTAIRFPAADTVTVETAGTERLRVDSSGNVGIGTTTPTDLLQLVGGNILLGTDSGDPFNTQSRVRIQGAGSEYIQIKGDGTGSLGLLLGDATDNFTAGILSSQPENNLIFHAGNAERMRIDSAGFVGIGNTAPVVPLHVTGDTMTTGVVYNNQPAQTSKAAAATLTIAELETGIIQYTGAAATLTLPTGTNIETGTPNTFPVNMAFDFSVINTGSGTATLGTATGLTLTGSMAVTAGVSGMFRVRKTATNTYTVYRIG